MSDHGFAPPGEYAYGELPPADTAASSTGTRPILSAGNQPGAVVVLLDLTVAAAGDG